MDIAGKTFSRYGFLINPQAGNLENPQDLQSLAEKFFKTSGEEIRTHISTDGADLLPAAEGMIRGGCHALIVAGGDGSVNRILPAVVGRSIPVGFLPMGTINLLAWELGLPWDIPSALRIIRAGKTASVDAAVADGRCFFQVAGLGFDAAILKGIRSRWRKRWRAFCLPFLGFTALADAPTRAWQIRCDGQEGTAIGRGVVIANGARYGGRFRLSPDVANNDGKLDVFIVPPFPLGELLRFYATCAGLEIHSRMQHMRGSRIGIRCEGSILGHADGEICLQTPLEISVQPRAISFFVP